jgi:folate-binding Fe-S cluster repair protein YgfZ
MPGAFFAPADPPRGVLRLAGEDRVAFLQGLVSNDVRTVDEAHGIWTAMLTPQGKYLFDFFLRIDRHEPRHRRRTGLLDLRL